MCIKLAKVAKRKDSKGVVLKSGEIQRVDGRYEFRFIDKIGRRHGIYASTLKELREKEEKLLSISEIKASDVRSF